MATRENLKFLIDLATTAMVSEDIMPMEDEPQTFNKAWNHPIPIIKEIARGHTKIAQQKNELWKKMLKSLMTPN